MRDIRKLQSLVRSIESEGPTVDNLKRAVIVLANEVIYLSRQVDEAETLARQVHREARLGSYRGVNRSS